MKTPHLKYSKTGTKRKNLNTKSKTKTKLKNSTISKNLIKKFEQAKSNRKNLKKFFDNFEITEATTENYNQREKKKVSNDEMFNELLNKVNKYRQVINFHEELNNQYINEVQLFINHFMNYFDEFTKFEDLNLNNLKDSFLRVEQLILNNFDISEQNENFKNSLNYFFNSLNEILMEKNKICNPQKDNLESTKNKIIEIIARIKNYANFLKEKLNKSIKTELLNSNFEVHHESNLDKLNDISIFEANFRMNPFSNNFHSNFSQLARNKLKNSSRKSKKLIETVQIKKSKKRYGEEDEINSDIENFTEVKRTSTKKGNLKKIIEKSKKIFLRNFLQIYLIKENGLFSESYFSKIDRNCLSAYKNFKFYEIKIYFNIQEETEDIQNYIFTLRKLFTCHIMTYNTLHYDPHKKIRFTKISISGIGKKQSSMKRNIINFISENVKLDCLIKISLFSNIFDCMSNSLKKIHTKNNLFFYTNINDSLLNRIVSRIKLDPDNDKENDKEYE